MVISQRSKRLISCPRSSLDETNITNGRNNCATIVDNRSETSDTRSFNVARFTDIRTNMVVETPPALSVSKTIGTSSLTASLPVQSTSGECEQQQQQEKSMEDSSVYLTYRRRREHECVLQTPEEHHEDNDRREEERRRLFEAEDSAANPSLKNHEEKKDVKVNKSVTDEDVDIVTTWYTHRNQSHGQQNQITHRMGMITRFWRITPGVRKE